MNLVGYSDDSESDDENSEQDKQSVLGKRTFGVSIDNSTKTYDNKKASDQFEKSIAKQQESSDGESDSNSDSDDDKPPKKKRRKLNLSNIRCQNKSISKSNNSNSNDNSNGKNKSMDENDLNSIDAFATYHNVRPPNNNNKNNDNSNLSLNAKDTFNFKLTNSKRNRNYKKGFKEIRSKVDKSRKSNINGASNGLSNSINTQRSKANINVGNMMIPRQMTQQRINVSTEDLGKWNSSQTQRKMKEKHKESLVST